MSLAHGKEWMLGLTFCFRVDAFEKCAEDPRKGVFLVTAIDPCGQARQFELKIDWTDPILFHFGGKREALKRKDAVAQTLLQNIELQLNAAGNIFFFFLLANSAEEGGLVYWDREDPEAGWTIAQGDLDTLSL